MALRLVAPAAPGSAPRRAAAPAAEVAGFGASGSLQAPQPSKPLLAAGAAFLAACSAWARPARREVRHRRRTATVRWAAESAARALIFDCDGVIAESEEMHRVAYNRAFAEFELDGVEWSKDYYDVLQNSVGGGKPKMRWHFGREGWPASKLGASPTDEASQERLVDALQARKTDIYKEMVEAGMSVARPGILGLVDAGLAEENVKTAICSASTKEAVQKVLESVLGAERLARFDLLILGDDVSRKKPDPLIYTTASERLGVPPEQCVVVEDSKIGLDAALGAGMACCITYTDSTKSQDFSGAKLVVPDATELSLGQILP